MSDWISALDTLAEVLARENAALTTLDFPGAVSLLEQKRAATAAFEAAGTAGVQGAPARAALQRLHELAAENRRLLERSLRVQSRVIGLIAGAAASATPVQYGQTGAARAAPFQPLALSARA